jgi:uncharacterized protein YecE (DUF72 family)
MCASISPRFIHSFPSKIGEPTSTNYLIGTGGWAYFQVPGLHPLVAYSQVFNFVEVNSTFYQLPPLKQVERWRRIVPEDFQFTVRVHRMITHKHKLQPTAETLETFGKTLKICETLKAEIIHLQTPQSLKMDQPSTKNLQDLFSSVELGKARIALEVRGIPPSRLPSRLIKIMRECNIIHCIDLSKGDMPAYKSDILYSRLFGRGYHNIYQPTDDEVKEIDRKATSGNFKKTVLSFHFTRMYKDAARLKIYKQTGKFPKITKSTGLSSLEEILKEDASFPTTKQELMRSQGWKLFDVTEDNRIWARGFLQKLPDKTYNNINEVLGAISSIVR